MHADFLIAGNFFLRGEDELTEAEACTGIPARIDTAAVSRMRVFFAHQQERDQSDQRGQRAPCAVEEDEKRFFYGGTPGVKRVRGEGERWALPRPGSDPPAPRMDGVCRGGVSVEGAHTLRRGRSCAYVFLRRCGAGGGTGETLGAAQTRQGAVIPLHSA